MTDEKIERINELARKSKTAEGLTEAEQTERAALRAEYIASFRASLRTQLEHTSIKTPDGKLHPLTRKGSQKH